MTSYAKIIFYKIFESFLVKHHMYHLCILLFLNLPQKFWAEGLAMRRNKPNHQMKGVNICEGSSLLSGQNQDQKGEREQKANNVK